VGGEMKFMREKGAGSIVVEGWMRR
jgi:hypothetical protein